MQIKNSKFYNVFESIEGKRKRIFTRNLVPGKRVYGENLVNDSGVEYREWEPRRSKLGSFIMKGADQIGLKPNDIVLYLGAASGTTVSHVSDIVGENGFVFAMDFAPRVMRELVLVSGNRKNISPILADANQPETYMHLVSQADFLFQDIAQPNQVEIFIKNSDFFLKHNGFGMLALKSRSVNVMKNPLVLFKEVRTELERHFTVVDARTLEPFERDHCVFLCKKK
ncbi:MAG: fibrillarin-like rRNA/tRNA 2'-O-methyltransferase [Candidatus Woesearchaeota archaeon]|nr:fibrillarin-like rRNA/tRNA 2'-O-methyltransferase [Candidatus Woesearchaeota archaeon]